MNRTTSLTVDSRTAILDAAEQLFRERGYAGTSIAQIRRRSGLPVGSIYHHFANKAALLGGVLSRSFSHFWSSVVEVDHREVAEGDLAGFWDAAMESVSEWLPLLRLEVEAWTLAGTEPELRATLQLQRTEVLIGLSVAVEPYLRTAGTTGAADMSEVVARTLVTYLRGAAALGGDSIENMRDEMKQYFALVDRAVRPADRVCGPVLTGEDPSPAPEVPAAGTVPTEVRDLD